MKRWLNRGALEATLFFVALGILWEYAVRAGDIKAYLLPAPSDILSEMWRSRTALLEHGWVTLQEVLSGFAFAFVFSPILAVMIFFVPVLRRTLYPLMIALQSIPKVGLAPIVVVWFGYGLSSKVLMAFLFAFFPLLIAALGGLKATPEHLVEHFRALRASFWQTLVQLRLPSAMPAFIDGCKVAMPLAVIGAVVGEFIGSYEGLGNLVMVASGSANSSLTFAALIAVTLLSLVLFWIIEVLGRLVWWQAR
ncbi:MAG TPA: ABC transporter permease [Steroidobacteraceae bacterium]|nr:ABC transporter permease [Steroidobacteraceae bacterium]HRX87906.1 ABC transporter permease [Steroidobacteraceae bacterium]